MLSKFISLISITIVTVALSATGCSSLPFQAKERSSIITPGMRAAAVREMAPLAEKSDLAEQQRLCEQLATQIRTEPDPLVRQEIQNTVSEFSTPLALRILTAGLNDEDREVRLTCCYRLAERGEESVDALRKAAASDTDIDVRLAAIDGLGKTQSAANVAALAPALSDRDPAVQYAAVQSLKTASGEDFGNDVRAWQQYVAGEVPAPQAKASVAQQVKQWSPF